MNHLLISQHPRGALLTCRICGQAAAVATQAEAQQFARLHAACAQAAAVSPSHYPLGNAVATVAKPVARALGRDPNCAPCRQRQQRLNRLVPRLWGRR